MGAAGWIHAANASKPATAEGCVVPFVFDNGTAWLGFFCMNEPLRGLGWGAKLFKACLDTIAKGGAGIVGLDGVEEQVATYTRRGFVDTARVRLMIRPGAKDLPLDGKFEHTASQHERLVPLDQLPTHILVEDDLAITGLKRGALWTKRALFDRDDAWGLALVKEGTTEELEGWILVRSCQQGFRIGPLYAETKANARFLLHQVMRKLEDADGSYITETWPGNPDAVAVFEESGWTWAGVDYHRMWLDGKVPEAQQKGGKADKEMYAIFDAAQG